VDHGYDNIILNFLIDYSILPALSVYKMNNK